MASATLPLTAAPKFLSIESVSFPGYFLTQQGTQVVLNAKNEENPFQLWYRDDACTGSVFINHGSRKGLKSHLTEVGPKSSKATVGFIWDPTMVDPSIVWCLSGDENGKVTISMASIQKAFLGLHVDDHDAAHKDGTPAVVSSSAITAWRFTEFKPRICKIMCLWVSQYLTWKPKNEDVKFEMVSGVKNDELNVVAVHNNNQNREGMEWYRVPAGGRQDTTFNSSFILINKATGLALKGSSFPGDKTVLTQYDPFDYGFVWCENRAQDSAGSNNIVIALDGWSGNLQWHLPEDNQYQNSAWYHPLTLMPPTANGTFLNRQTFRFIPV